MITCLLLLATLTAVAIASIRTANTEVQIVRNEGQLVKEFYHAEAGLIDALENSDTWITSAFLAQNATDANDTFDSTVNDDGGNPVASVETRCIESTGTTISGLSDAANELPTLDHIDAPPEESGYSMRYFEIRRFGVTVTSANGNTRMQVGTWKVFNKY